MKRMEIEIWADGMARVVESEPIAGDGDPQPASETAQAEPEAAADSSYGETVKLDHNSPEFDARKAELKNSATNGIERRRSGASQPILKPSTIPESLRGFDFAK